MFVWLQAIIDEDARMVEGLGVLNQVVMYSVCFSDSVNALVYYVCTGGCMRYISSRRSRGDSDVCVIISSHGSLPTVSLRRAFRLGMNL